MSKPYVVEVERNGCEYCGAEKYWVVVFTPDNLAGGTSYSNEEEAEDMAAAQNDAYEKGRAAAYAELRREKGERG